MRERGSALVRALRRGGFVLVALLLTACGQTPQRPVTTRTPSETVTLQQRLEALAARPAPEVEAAADARELAKRIEELQAARQTLLQRYTEQHPQVILLDRRIARLRERLSEATTP